MTAHLNWWLVVCISLLLTGAAAQAGYAEQIIATDWTYISLGIVVLYLGMTAWIGWAVHTGHKLPAYWASYLIGLMPALGLIGTLVGIVQLFGLDTGAGDLDSAAIYSGLGTAIYTTLTGLVFSEFLFLQMKVLERE